MPLRAMDEQRVHWHCGSCNTPQSTHLAAVVVMPEALLLICDCGGHEALRRDLTRHDSGEEEHPQSLVGTELPGGAVVIEHTIGGVGLQHRQEQARLIRALDAQLAQ